MPLFILSLAISAYGALRQETSAFYLLHSRAWELALGSLLALNLFKPPAARWVRECVSIAGALAIGIPVLFYSDQIAFPGFAALMPCLGAAALIWTGEHPTLMRLGLSLRPVVWIGLISYSLYLWHWPVIVLQKTTWLIYTGQSRLIEKIIVLALCFGLATASWWLVERPFRNRAIFAGRNTLFIWAGATGTALCLCFGIVIAGQGLPGLFPGRGASASLWLAYDPALSTREGTCLIDEDSELAPSCLALSADKPNVLLLGDSHAAHLWAGLSQAFPQVNVVQATSSSCPPTRKAMATFYPACRKALRQGLALIEGGRIDKVILAGNWLTFGGDDGLSFARELRERGVDVVLFGPPPYNTRPLPRLLVLAQRTKDVTAPAEFIRKEVFDLDAAMAVQAQVDGTPYVSELAIWCPGRVCRTTLDGAPIQFDSNHYTAEASLETIRRSNLTMPLLKRHRDEVEGR